MLPGRRLPVGDYDPPGLRCSVLWGLTPGCEFVIYDDGICVFG